MHRMRALARALARIAIPLWLALFAATAAWAADAISLSDKEWSAGTIRAGRVVEKQLSVTNGGKDELKLEIDSDTARLSVEPDALQLAPGATAFIKLFFDANGNAGDFSYRLAFRAKDGAGPEKTFPVNGKIDSSSKITEVDFFYYFASNCHECLDFLNITVPGLEEKLGVSLNVWERDVLIPANIGLYKHKVKQLGQKANDLPSVIIGDTVLQGYDQIDRELERVLASYAAGTVPAVEANPKNVLDGNAAGGSGSDDALAVFPVILAGLIDGVNPCVISTLIFLLAYLAFAGRTKKQVLIIGVVYSLVVFVTYYLIGLGFFQVIQALTAFPPIALVIQIVLWVVLILFGALSIHDFIKIRQNKVKEVKLQLSDRFKDRIRKTIRTQAASVTIVASTIVVAFTVTLFELACTGQIYLPTITALVRTRRHISDFIYLGIYNLAFIAPLVLVFFLTYRGMTSQKLTAFFQKHMALVKLVTAVLFFGLAAVVAIINIPLLLVYISKLFGN
ncbi:MAG: hypothetical protein JXD23_04075 [Spirochaetales bacterium]|nr:hypothetical protein [Spirochaetales bacterium]